MGRKVIGTVLALVFIAIAPALAGQPPENGSLTLERIFGREPIEGRLPRGLEWRPGHEQVVFVERRGEGDGARDVLVGLDPATGERTDLLDAANLEEAFDGETPSLGRTVFTPDGGAILLERDDGFWLVRLGSNEPELLDPQGGRYPAFSPDGQRLAFVRQHDLYVLDLPTGHLERVTSDGSATIRNGELDWVYEEELADRNGKAFEFSPDGSAILWLRTDDSAIPPFTIVDLLGTHSRVIEQRYPKAGDPAPTVVLQAAWFDAHGVVRARQTIDPGTGDGYLARFGWWPGTGGIWCQLIDHAQDRLSLVRVDLPSGRLVTIHEEIDPHWVEPVDLFHTFPDGRFLWGSRSSGFMHLQLRAADGTLVRDLTPGPFEVTALAGVDEASGMAWYQIARPTPMERRIERVRLTGGPSTEIGHGPGTWSAKLSPRHGFLLVRSSTITSPPRADVCRADGTGFREVAVCDTAAVDALGFEKPRFLTVTADDGTALNAELIVPPHMEPGRRYPVVVYVYGGPHAQVVRNAWGRSTLLFHEWLARQGFVVFSLDNRGSAARGRRFEGAVDWRLGQLELSDQLAGVRWLKSQDFVDPERIGIWGWSYGGYMTCYALTHAPGVFAAGAAVAPVTDWHLYDSIYTERYMGTPGENPEGYAAGSVLEAAENLGGALLVIHGTGDDNVHFQNTVQLAERAWRAGKTFDLMLFPNLKHGIYAKGSHLQVFRRIARHFLGHLAKGGPSGQ